MLQLRSVLEQPDCIELVHLTSCTAADLRATMDSDTDDQREGDLIFSETIHIGIEPGTSTLDRLACPSSSSLTALWSVQYHLNDIELPPVNDHSARRLLMRSLTCPPESAWVLLSQGLQLQVITPLGDLRAQRRLSHPAPTIETPTEMSHEND